MPPFVNGKRRFSSAEPDLPPKKKAKLVETNPSEQKAKEPAKTKRKKKKNPKPQIRTELTRLVRKPTLFDTVDSNKHSGKIPANRLFGEHGDSDDNASSDAESEDFEDVVTRHDIADTSALDGDEEDEATESEDWENAIHNAAQSLEQPESPTEDLQLNLGGPRTAPVTYADLTGGKKQGPSKKDKQRRMLAHSMHVQFLMWHNHVRNHWLNDQQVQKALVDHMQRSQQMRVQYDSWKRKAGILTKEKPDAETKPARGKRSSKGKQRINDKGDPRSERDWGRPAERQAVGEPDLSRGDPLQQFLGTLATWWKQAFTITAPGLRKRGYKSPRELRIEIEAWRDGTSGIKSHGEKIANIKEFRALANLREGSRDVGAQLFVALLRGLGIEARMVTSLQPLGFGFTKVEEADPSTKSETSNAREQNTFSSKKKQEKPPTATAGSSKTDAIPLSDTSDLSDLSDANGGDDDESDTSVIDITPKKRPNMPFDRDLPFPTYWIEAISALTHRCFPVDPFVVRPSVATSPDHLMLYEARGAKADKAHQVFAYVVAHSSDNTAKDVTVRYIKKHVWPGKTKGFRLPMAKIPVHDRHGKVRAYYEIDWWRSVLQGYRRPDAKRTVADDIEDQGELQAVQPEKKAPKEGVPDTLDGFKKSTEYVLARNLRREEALLPGAESVQTFKAGKGAKASEEQVYLRKDVAVCRTSESWHKEGRQVKIGEQPLKMVPVRAVTATRKREVEETERTTGEKAMQGMYSKDQTEWIVPDPIRDGVIPKNSYGNMDAFVPQMVPKGAVHIPLRGTVRICKKLEIDYAEAVTGFEFGNRMAVPVIEGVIVAAENEDMVLQAWETAEEERKAREAIKQEKLVLGKWRRFLMGLRIAERMRDEFEIDVDAGAASYQQKTVGTGDQPQVTSSEGQSSSSDTKLPRQVDHQSESDITAEGGGFLPEDENDSEFAGGFVPETRQLSDAQALVPSKHNDLEHRTSRAVVGTKMRSLAQLAAQQGENEKDYDLETESQLTPEGKFTKLVAQSGSRAKQKVASRGRSSKSSRPGARRVTKQISPAVDSEASDESMSSAAVAKTPVATTPGVRKSSRTSAKASQSKIRSHFFDDESELEGEAESSAENEDPTPVRKRTRGRRSAK